MVFPGHPAYLSPSVKDPVHECLDLLKYAHVGRDDDDVVVADYGPGFPSHHLKMLHRHIGERELEPEAAPRVRG